MSSLKSVAMHCLLLLFVFASSTFACVTLPTPNGVSGKACRFPFTYQGRSYSECTTAGGYSQVGTIPPTRIGSQREPKRAIENRG